MWFFISNYYVFYEIRLIGLVCQGSIPWVSIGIIVFIMLVLIKHFINLSECSENRKEVTMIQKTKTKLSIAIVQTIWTIGTNVTAGVLPA